MHTTYNTFQRGSDLCVLSLNSAEIGPFALAFAIARWDGATPLPTASHSTHCQHINCIHFSSHRTTT